MNPTEQQMAQLGLEILKTCRFEGHQLESVVAFSNWLHAKARDPQAEVPGPKVVEDAS